MAQAPCPGFLYLPFSLPRGKSAECRALRYWTVISRISAFSSFPELCKRRKEARCVPPTTDPRSCWATLCFLQRASQRMLAPSSLESGEFPKASCARRVLEPPRRVAVESSQHRKPYLFRQGHGDCLAQLVQAAVDSVPSPLFYHFMRNRGSL